MVPHFTQCQPSLGRTHKLRWHHPDSGIVVTNNKANASAPAYRQCESKNDASHPNQQQSIIAAEIAICSHSRRNRMALVSQQLLLPPIVKLRAPTAANTRLEPTKNGDERQTCACCSDNYSDHVTRPNSTAAKCMDFTICILSLAHFY